MIVSRRAVLLDFDGVLCKSKTAERFIGRRCIEFVKQMTGLSHDNAVALNNVAYQTSGHTSLGLVRMGYGGSNAAQMLGRFNYHVYEKNKIDYKRLFFESGADEDGGFNLDEFLELCYRCHNTRTDVFIFSNAPSCWVNGVCESFGVDLAKLKVSILPVDQHVKPCIQSFVRAERALEDTHGYHASRTTILFADDKMFNLAPISSGSGCFDNRVQMSWLGMHYTPQTANNSPAHALLDEYELAAAAHLYDVQDKTMVQYASESCIVPNVPKISSLLDILSRVHIS